MTAAIIPGNLILSPLLAVRIEKEQRPTRKRKKKILAAGNCKQ